MNSTEKKARIVRFKIGAIYEFKNRDTDIVGQLPSVASDPQVLRVFHKTAVASGGTITPPNSIEIFLPPGSGSTNLISFNDTQKFVGVYIGAQSANQTITLFAMNRRGENQYPFAFYG